MCGSGSIPVEAALAQNAGRLPRGPVIGGDIDGHVLPMIADNVAHCRVTASLDVVPLDSCRLPFRDGAVDAIVTDLPFGKRIGSFASIQTFYPAAFEELARVTRFGGRAVLLTQQHKTARLAPLPQCPPPFHCLSLSLPEIKNRPERLRNNRGSWPHPQPQTTQIQL
eukprot:EG_transcript_22901